ncbi:carbohydrate ABC transporter permease [Halorarius litoreus]|uniref:carbohydrate ABC transporter permease n=1 Tax=Halorarius litoreus TaxID=2962676 RepID=UPI0020CE7194|nr:carbohydrate ABC transporter permease [Halorarius litoreus]
MTAETPSTESDGGENLGPFQRWARSAIQNPEKVYRAMFYVVTVFFLVTTLFPFYWLLVLAVTPENQAYALVPNGFDPSAFVDVFDAVAFARFMFNSLLLATVTTVFVLLIASLAGYVFGRLRFPGRRPLMLIVLAVSYFPPAAFLLPLFRLFTGNIPGLGFVELYNTPGAMILPFSALFLPLSIFILTTFYGQIPDGLEDAARVEGTTRLGALFRVIMPLSAPGVATAGVLTFIAVYNEYFFSSLMTNGEAATWSPIVRGILQLQQAGQFEVTYGMMAAGSIIAVLPVAILVVVAQEKIVSGLTSGALKE